LPCFCWGHNSTCKNSRNFGLSTIESNLRKGIDEWTVSDKENKSVNFGFDEENGLFVQKPSKDVWFNAPS
jgi:hypothetical protein